MDEKSWTIFSSSEFARSFQDVWVVVGVVEVGGSMACAGCSFAYTDEFARLLLLRPVGREPLQELVLDPVRVVPYGDFLPSPEPLDEFVGACQVW